MKITQQIYRFVFWWTTWSVLGGLGLLGMTPLAAQVDINPIIEGKVYYESALLATRFVKLDGEWEYYPDTLLSPEDIVNLSPSYTRFPQTWNDLEGTGMFEPAFGYATYRLTITLSDDQEAMGLSMPDFYTAYRLYVNGVVFSENGVVGQTRETTQPYWLPIAEGIKEKSSQYELVLQIANFHHRTGGPGESIRFGGAAIIEVHIDKINYLAYGLFGSFVMCGLFVLGFYLFGQQDGALLAFAFFCLCHGYRMIGSEDYQIHALFPSLSFGVAAKLEYLSLYASFVFFWEFTYRSFTDIIEIKFSRAIQLGTLVCLAIVLVTPARVYTYSLPFFHVLFFSSVLYAVYFILNGLRKYREKVLFFALGFSCLTLNAIAIIANIRGWWDTNLVLILMGYMSFLFFQTLHVSSRFARNYQRLAQAADAANRAKSEFLATVSHEIRTPMNGVLGMTNLLAKTTLDTQQKQYLDTVQSSGNSLLSIIDDILDLSKIEAGRMDLDIHPFSPQQLVHSTTQLMAPRAKEKGLEFEVEVAEGTPTVLEGDVGRIRQVLYNLLGNAIKFTTAGKVGLSLRYEQLAADKIQLHFDVNDTGMGIPRDIQKHLFKPFSQADTSISRRFGGTGLGLAISRQLVQLMGGKIGLKSEVGKGAAFFFSVPFKISSLESLPIPEGEVFVTDTSQLLASSLPLQILLVEDHPINQKLVLTILGQLGYEVDLAEDGWEAVEMYKSKEYDLILMDIQMPRLDGLEATRRIRKMKKEGFSPIILAMTANALEEDRENCLKVGMDDYIVKPLKSGILETMILKWCKEQKNNTSSGPPYKSKV